MRRYAVIVLSFTFLFIQLRYSLVQVDYWVNVDEIVRTLCVERDVENSTCAGKCHLKKQIAEIEKAGAGEEDKGKTLPFEELRFLEEEIILHEFGDRSKEIARSTPFLDRGLSDGWPFGGLHPPDFRSHLPDFLR